MPSFTLNITLFANAASREDALQMARNAQDHLMETFNDDGSLSGGRVDVIDPPGETRSKVAEFADFHLGRPYEAERRIPIGTRVAHYSAGMGVREGVVIGITVTITLRTHYRVRLSDGTEQYNIPVHNLQVLPDVHNVVTGKQYRYQAEPGPLPTGNYQHNGQTVTVLCSLGPNVDGSEGFEVQAPDGWKGWASSRELRELNLPNF